jgi:hypothetical protein
MPENPWNEILQTPSSHLIALVADGMQGIQPGDVIGVFGNNNTCYGVTEIADLKHNALITAYADDNFTGEKDGFDNGEAFSFKLYRPGNNEVYELDAVFSPAMPDGNTFVNEGLSAITMLKTSSTGIAGATGNDISIYPNPTDGRVWITGVNGYDQLTLMSNTGKVLLQRHDLDQDKIELDLSGFSNGIYQVRLTGKQGAVVRKVVKD